MPVIKYTDLKFKEIEQKEVKNTAKAIAVGEKTGWEDYTLRVFKIESGGFTPRHKHEWEHVNYIIRGRGRLRIGETLHEIEETDFAFIPPGTEHQFENPNTEPLEFICIVPNRGNY